MVQPLVRAALCAALALTAATATAQEIVDLRKQPPLQEDQITKAFENTSMTAKAGEFDLTLSHGWGGEVKMLSVFGFIEGTWRVEDDQYCWRFESLPPMLELPTEACYKVVRRRDGLTLVDPSTRLARLTLTPSR